MHPLRRPNENSQKCLDMPWRNFGTNGKNPNKLNLQHPFRKDIFPYKTAGTKLRKKIALSRNSASNRAETRLSFIEVDACASVTLQSGWMSRTEISGTSSNKECCRLASKRILGAVNTEILSRPKLFGLPLF